MKKLIATLALILTPVLFFGQSAFDKFDGREGISVVVINKSLFELAGKIKVDVKDKDAQKYLDQVDSLDNLQVYTTKDSKFAAEMKSTVDSYLKKNNMEELMRVSDGGRNVRIYVKQVSKSSVIKELLLFVQGGTNEETVIVSLTGSIQL